jgi:hypothetical protein
MMPPKKKIQYPNLFYEKNFQKLIIFLLIVLIATAIAGRKQFVLDPYESFDSFPSVATKVFFDSVSKIIHPIYSENFYTPPTLKLVSPSLLLNKWFHVFSAIAFLALTIGGMFSLIRMTGFTTYQSIAMTLFTLYAGSLITRELFNIPLLGPAPFISYEYYSIRTPVIPLSIFGLIFIINRRFFIGGLLIGLATFFHIKFGFRLFGLLFFSLLLWKLWGLKRLELPEQHITWKNIAAFLISWGGIFVISYAQILSDISILDTLDLPQSNTFFSQLALLIKNEPDDYLITYFFGDSRPFIGFLLMTGSIGLFCELIIRYSCTNQMKKFAAFWEIAALGALVFFGAGFLFESFLINWLPVNISHSIVLTRFWDLVWVVIIGFWVTLLPAITLFAEKIMCKLKKTASTVGNAFFHVAMVLFLCINTAIFLINKNGEVIKVSKIKSGEKPFFWKADYVQICDPISPDYNKFYREALNSLQVNDHKGFRESISHMDKIFNAFKVNFKNPPLRNPDSVYLNAINHTKNGNFSEMIKMSTTEHKETYWWSCSHSEPGIHTQSIHIPTKDFLDATDWIKLNLPVDKGVIQPPYLINFTMLSQRIGFWDGKVDQHNMYLLKPYHGAGFHRLRSVAGPDSMMLEAGAKHGKLGPGSREYFLSLAKKDIIKIQNNYPEYNYFLTENHNLSGYLKMYSNTSLALYDISNT